MLRHIWLLALAVPAFGQIEVYHKTASVEVGTTRQFTAYVPLSPSTVVWSVDGIVGGNATIGTVSSSGLYAAPAAAPTPSVVKIRATSTAQPDRFGEATVTVTRKTPWIWSASPSPLAAGAFEVRLNGSNFTPDAVVKMNGMALPTVFVSSTSLRATGTAAAGTAAFTVYLPGPGEVTSQALNVTVAAPAISVSPVSATVGVNGTVAFTASAAATWQVNGVTGGSASVGFITAAGVYTAPATAGTVTVRAVSVADPAKFASATVTVTGAPELVSRLAAGRLLEQAAFGGRPADIAKVQQMGIEAWLDEQFALPETAIPDQASTGALRSWQLHTFVHAPDQLRQRMTYSLEQLVVTSLGKLVYPNEILPWMRIVQKNAFGNYRTLLREVTVSPSMGKYLDLANSTKAEAGSAPNENYPRELMQLFSFGLWELNPDGSQKLDAGGQPIPTYSQETVRQVARALTGWTYPTAPGGQAGGLNWENFTGPMEPRPAYHDTGAKSFLGCTLAAGQTVEQDLEATIDCVFQHPSTPPFVATRLIRSLVKSNPSPAYIGRIAAVFVNNGAGVRGDLRAVARAILLDPEARQDTPDATSGRLKEPVYFVSAFLRAMNGSIPASSGMAYVYDDMGQSVLAPPSVFNWFSPLYRVPKSALYGPEFQIYTPTEATLRANFLYQVMTGQGGGLTVDLSNFQAVAGNTAGLLDEVDRVLFYGRMPAGVRNALQNAVTAAYDNNQRVQAAVYLAALSGQYAVQY